MKRREYSKEFRPWEELDPKRKLVEFGNETYFEFSQPLNEDGMLVNWLTHWAKREVRTEVKGRVIYVHLNDYIHATQASVGERITRENEMFQPLWGWPAVAKCLGMAESTARKHKKELTREGVITFNLTGNPPKRQVMGYPYLLMRYRMRKSLKK